MDIVGKIGAYFANHEAQMRLVMQHARDRQRVAAPELDDDPIDRASRLLDKCLDSFEATVVPPISAQSPRPSPRHARPLSPPPPEVKPATTPRKPKRLKRKKPKVSSAVKAAEAAKAAELAAIKQKLVDDAISVTKERARKIQMDKELRLKAEAALAAEQQSRRETQLQQIESIRRQAFRPVPTSAAPTSPNQVTSPRQPAPPRMLTDAWSERVPPRRHTILGLRKPAKQPTTPSPAAAKHTRSASLSHLEASMPSPNQPQSEAIRPTTPSPRIDPMTKFGPIQDNVSSTPFLDRLEHMELYRAQKASEAAMEAKHRVDVAAAQAAQQRRMDLACNAKVQQNLELDRHRQLLEGQKAALEASLQALHTESSQLRSERHKIAMARRVARRAMVKSNNSDDAAASSADLQGWVQDETDRANQAAKARAEAKRRVQMRRAPPAISTGPETVDDTTGSSTPRQWHVSPLPQPRWDAAFFGYSSGSDTE